MSVNVGAMRDDSVCINAITLCLLDTSVRDIYIKIASVKLK